jgi:tetratricopeptide (TPR) repeat protein
MHALALVKSGRSAEAIEPLQECIAKRNDRTYTSPFKGATGTPPFHLLADCLARSGDLESALEGYKTALEMDPKSPGIRHDYAKLLAHQERPEEAIELLNQAIQSDSMESRLWTLGSQIVNGHLNDIDIALRWTECAIEQFPKNPEIRKQRGIALITAGQFESALPLFEETPPHPLTDAARILCQITTDKKSDPAPVDPTQEVVVSSALINWYRRFLERGLTDPAQKVTQRIESIEAVLPSAAKMLKEAITEDD